MRVSDEQFQLWCNQYNDPAATPKDKEETFNKIYKAAKPYLKTLFSRWRRVRRIDFPDIESILNWAVWHCVQNYDSTKSSFLGWVSFNSSNAFRSLIARSYEPKYNETNMLTPDSLEEGSELSGWGVIYEAQDSALDRLTYSEQTSRLWAFAKAHLTPLEFECLRLRYQENIHYQEIATRLNIPKKRADNALSRGVRKLQSMQPRLEALLSINDV
jgi:RNA polymerase sigma factor (sigma-70 family)